MFGFFRLRGGVGDRFLFFSSFRIQSTSSMRNFAFFIAMRQARIDNVMEKLTHLGNSSIYASNIEDILSINQCLFSKTGSVCKLFHGLLSFVSEPLVRGLQRSCGHVNWSPQASGQPQREYVCLPQNIAKLLSLNNYEVLLKNCTYIPMGNF